MSRNPEKYLYVEVALPRDNAAVQRLVAESERLDIALRVLIKQAALTAYSGEEEEEPVRRSASRSAKKQRKAASSLEVPASALDSAAAFLDDEGF